ncbi:unnamed protein product [Paramecium octaurelia]|uniref:Auxin efflux carrier n=1 Tax=Paramecium octaurelia TaxID=43137 RepID=A0A8S1WKT3_PAROT|nr:unnamed protein product [Paramecium octaurelia]CAD8189287.1 unnamed protein product [Paramecium octaurelia]
MIILTIIEAVVSATFGALAVASSGALLTHQKIFNNEFTMTLSKVVERMFLPAMIFTNFLKTVTFDSLLGLIPTILTTFFCIFCGYLIGVISNKYWIKKENLNSIIVLSSANPHTINIQLQIAYGLTTYFSKITNQSEKETEAKLVTIIIIQTVIVNAFRWSIGKRIMQQHKIAEQQNEVELLNLKITQPQQQQVTQNKKQESSFWNPPLISVIVSLLCLPIQKQLVNDTFIHRALFLPLQTISRACPPSVLMILGSNLYLIYFKNTQKKENLITILQIVANRLILLPIIGLTTVICLDQIGIMTDLCELFILFITFCTPSAITILVMAKQYQQQLEDVVSLILFYGYILCIITLPVWMTIYLAIFQPK